MLILAPVQAAIYFAYPSMPWFQHIKRPAQQEYIRALAQALADLHFKSLSANDFSKQLGFRAITVFYMELLQSSYGKVFYSRHSNGEVISVCCIFSNYVAFQARLKKRLFPIIAFALVSGRLKPSSLLAEVRRGKSELPPTIKKFHLGLIARNEKYGPAATGNLVKNITEATNYARRLGIDRLWASTLTTNVTALRFLEKSGFTEFNRKADVVYLVRQISDSCGPMFESEQ